MRIRTEEGSHFFIDMASLENSGSAVTTVASTSRSGTRSGMDVSDIAAEALPSVVAITNISVQEVQSYA